MLQKVNKCSHLVLAITLGGVRGHPEARSVARLEPLVVDGVDGRLAQVEAVTAPLVRHQEEGAAACCHAGILEIMQSFHSVSGKTRGFEQITHFLVQNTA